MAKRDNRWCVTNRIIKWKRRKQAMLVSKDRVQFYLSGRNFVDSRNYGHKCQGFKFGEMVQIMCEVFGMDRAAARDLLDSNKTGVHVLCRPDQFAKFIIRRYELSVEQGGINSIKDLEPEYLCGLPDFYQQIADSAGCTRAVAKRVAAALGYDALKPERTDYIDVSKNPNRARDS